MKLKKLLESTPGYKARQFGDPLPTLASVQAAHQAKQVNENPLNTDPLTERPISRGKVGGQLGDTNLKSNIDTKWASTEDMEDDLRSWLEATFEVSGPQLVKEIGMVLKQIGISAIKDGTTGGEDRPAAAADLFN